MSGYRDNSTPGLPVVRLVAYDMPRLRRSMLAAFTAFVIGMPLTVLLIGRFADSPEERVVASACGFLVACAFFGALVMLVVRARVTRFRLELGEGHLRLHSLNGDTLADTRSGNLTFERITYVVHGSGGRAWQRPGWAMKHPGGEHVVGVVKPLPVWSHDLPLDRRPAEFELRKADFKALAQRLD